MSLETRSRIDRLIGLLESAREEAGRLADEADGECRDMENPQGEIAPSDEGGRREAALKALCLRSAEHDVREAIMLLRYARKMERQDGQP